ncbi:MAG: sulfite exporter TauE/SafE family protein [Magnetococcus sp. XQGC-1]
MGGGIIKVTGLMLFFGYGMLLIRPVAYITNIFLYGAAVLRYRKSDLILWDAVRGLIPWAMIGVGIGYFLGNVIGNQWIRYLLALFALLVGVRMVVEILSGRADEARRGGVPRRDNQRSWMHYLGIGQIPEGAHAPANTVARDGILGLPMGIVSGILGITGGVVEVPLQRYVAGVPLRNAIANSAVLVFFASLVGSIVAMTHGIQTGAFDWSAPIKLAIILVPGAYVGGLIGAWLTTVVPLSLLRWLYAALMFVIAGRMVMP